MIANKLKRPKLIYPITFILAACSILYELLIAQTVSSLATNIEYWYVLTIGLYLGAMGLGALYCSNKPHTQNPWKALFYVELLLSFVGGLSVFFMHVVKMTGYLVNLHGHYLSADIIYCLSFIILTVSIGFLSGIELPLLINIAHISSQKKKITNRVLAADYFGSLIGALIFPLYLLPRWDIIPIGFSIALINLAIAFFLYQQFVKTSQKKHQILTLGIGTLLILGLTFSQAIEQYFLHKRYHFSDYFFQAQRSKNIFTYFGFDSSLAPIERYHTPYQKIDIVKHNTQTEETAQYLSKVYSQKYKLDPQTPWDYTLHLDGAYQLGSNSEEIYHEYFAHVPIILNQHKPKNILVIGGGDGCLIRELLKHSFVTNIVHVELDKKMIELSKTHPVLSYLNKGALNHPKVTSIIADGYHFIRTDTENYDAIYLDFPDPKNYNLSKLYSKEFYQIAQRRLKQDGFIALDMPGTRPLNEENLENSQMPELWPIYYNTTLQANFKTILPFFAILEEDNAEAFEVINMSLEDLGKAWLKKTGVGTERGSIDFSSDPYIAKQMIKIYTTSRISAFLFLKKEPLDNKRRYDNLNIPLYVLNEKRFHLAFPAEKRLPRHNDSHRVNSIMRPTLPLSDSFFPKIY